MTFFSTSDRLEIGGVPLFRTEINNRFEALEYYRRVCSSWALDVKLYEKVNAIRSTGQQHEVETSKGIYHTRIVILPWDSTTFHFC